MDGWIKLDIIGEHGAKLEVELPPQCQQELFPLPLGEVRRTINGELLNLSTFEERKFKTRLCSKASIPVALSSAWKGTHVEISCAQSLFQAVDKGKEVSLERIPVAGSVYLYQGPDVAFEIEGKSLIFHEEFTGIVGYRPRLRMRITNFHLDMNQENLTSTWQLDMEEI